MRKYICIISLTLLVSSFIVFGSRETTVAIIPFENLTNKPDFLWIGHGFSETLNAGLIGFKEIRMVERYKIALLLDEINLSQTGLINSETVQETGKLLGADFITVGSYQINNNQIRVNCRIIEVTSGEIKVAIQLTDDYNNIFGIQDSLITVLLSHIGRSDLYKSKKKVVDIETPNFKAYEWAIKGDLTLEKRDFSTAAEFYEKSLELDDNYKRARDGLNYAYWPMAVGNEWYYQINSESDSEYMNFDIKSSRKIIGKEVYKGLPCVIQELIVETEIGGTKPTSRQYVAYNENGLRLIKYEYKVNSHINEIDVDRQWWKFPLKQGDSWKSISTVGAIPMEVTYYVDEGIETITVPAGTYECIRVYGETKSGGAYPATSRFSSWLTKGVGVIKNQTVMIINIQGKETRQTTTSELLNFNINGYTEYNKIVRSVDDEDYDESYKEGSKNKSSDDEKLLADKSLLLDIIKVQEKYFMVYQDINTQMNINDDFFIVRNEKPNDPNSEKIIGKSKVVKIVENKVALEYDLYNKNDKLTINDKLKYSK